MTAFTTTYFNYLIRRVGMVFTDRTACAVKECGLPASEFGNLCGEHEVPGAIVRIGNDTGIITCWFVERRGEAAVIVLNDFA
jgi:hypothetical protein